ncbi:DUF4357 domain-containing protein [Bradyrhizobium sp. U87765 SZCCT0131]|uniref:DUF4357 domain-containing protein n=1 Tax=unclassified Bradyrhizobium TaxID=2631580 RepID=UPI001BA60476|nr:MULTISPECIES: DUF4357 domain-containing protein [unclassified Bradyrhizobium]MBR1216410.1 DUF4357 domain-containing protein [Bradyrhizobium sp. U87765 SZCCT0131]MBR1259842.1 DUF4357 domain-containing protein [Bradyrhizobium sp. U87765 SZCCT0134]MBR1305975.1 DUF4357 domain-containing protein [Bradyrhizobium sp. U87765 SZCCT0110]MBR1322342.1 DUF4357 domain-containing protein [Bradyrhizobium sp. U87765 SZCCT0109]MBR1352367.1 DUF4357 domain-containing protein [Bradyrhizobium sp. U87765 SZCCT004
MRGLVIREPWIGKILAGTKTWEMRSRVTLVRGAVALIRQGSGLVVGTASLIECLPALTKDNYLDHADRHQIPGEMLDEVIGNGWVHPWVLSDAHPLASPIPYQHKSGAVTFVSLDEAVATAIRCESGRAIGERTIAASRTQPARDRTADPMVGRAKGPPSGDNSAGLVGNVPVFVFRAEAAQAYGIPAASAGFVVLKGSTAVREGRPVAKRDRPLRDELLRSGVLAPDADPRLLRFTSDYEFTSPSSAACIVKDGNASGPSLWKSHTSGLSLRDYLASTPHAQVRSGPPQP